MIAYLPGLYPDELVYSWFCRYFVHSGCLTHKMALNEILYKRCNNPSKEFIGHINDEIAKTIQDILPMEQLIIKHTMFPQYARFIPQEQKKKALYHIGFDFCDVHHLFAILPRGKNDLYLKYCPICADEDRRQYGEAYWHRIHQIRNMQICTKHNCRLVNSAVVAKSEQTFTLCPAESHIGDPKTVIEADPLKISFARYMVDVFNAPIDFEKDIPISAVMYHGMQNTQYIKSTGKTRYTKLLSEDIHAYYTRLNICDIASMSQIQRILLGGDRFDFSVICQIAFYLGMGVETLTNPMLTAAQIEQEQNTHYMTDRPAIDWQVYDIETAPILERVAKSIYDGTASETGRPERVSEKIIYREMGFPGHRLENLPLCKAVFDKYSEPYEENWARRIVWAYDKLKTERKDKPFYWSDIRLLSGVKKKSIEKVMPYLKKHAHVQKVRIIEKMIMNP